MLTMPKVRATLFCLFTLWLLVVGLAGAAPAAARPAPVASATATLTIYPLADSDVVLNSATNFGAAGDVHVDYIPAGPTYSRALIQFSLADLAYDLPEGATVLTATLKLHLTVDAPLTETLTIHTGSGPEWGEDTVNWSSQPAWGAPSVALNAAPGSGDRVWNVTALLQGWLDGSLANRGLAVLGPESGPDAYSFVFDSRTGTFPPQLQITYALPAPTAPPPTQIPIPSHPPASGQPSAVLSDDAALAGTELRITGFDFPTDLCARYDTFLIQTSVTATTGLTPTVTLLGSTEPKEGNFTTQVFTVPADAHGSYTVMTLGGGHQASAHLVVTPTVVAAEAEMPALINTASLSANPVSGAPGTRVTVSGSGFTGAACSPVNFYWQKNLSTDASTMISVGTGWLSGGAISFSFAVPPSANGPAILWAVGPNNVMATMTFTVCCQPAPPPPPANPVMVNLCATADTYVASNLPNPTGSTNLNVGYSYNNVQQTDNFSLSLVRFDLTSIPVGATVNQATFQLTALNAQQASGLNPVQLGVFELIAPWPENSFTWAQLQNLSPYASRELSRQTVGNAPGAVYTWNVTAAAQDWVDSPGANNGLSVEDVGAQFLAYNRAFSGREAGSGVCPLLTITYDPSTAGNDLYVGGVDLVQTNGRPIFLTYARTAQTVNASAAPIAGKSTLLRVFAGTANPLSQVTGTVSGFPCGSNNALAGSPLTPVDGPIQAAPQPDPTQRNAALNFVLPSSWLTGCIDFSMTLTSVGAPESASKLANNTARWDNITFQSTQTLNLVLIPMQDTNSGSWASAAPQYVGPILTWVNAVFPLADGDIQYWTIPLQFYSQDLPGDGSDLLDDLEGIRDSIKGLPANTRYLGLVPGNFGGMARRNGRSDPNAGNVAWVSSTPAGAPFSVTAPDFYGPTWAQEIGHLFGRMHASDAHQEASGGAVDCQYPSWGAYFNHGGIGSYGVAFNTDSWISGGTPYQPNAFIVPGTTQSHAHDFMSYGGSPRWTSPYTFDALARAFRYQSPLTGIDCDDLAMRSAALPESVSPASPVDLIRLTGHIRADHGVEWHAAFHSQDAAPTLGLAGEYSLELRDITNTVLLTDYFDGQQTLHLDAGDVSFSELLPWPPTTARIVLKHHDYVLAEQSVSATAPTVTVTAPITGQSVGAQLTVAWQGTDPDGGWLTYAVLYNTGTGAEWWPIVAGLTATAGLPVSYTVATDLLAGSAEARVKVLVSDGVHGGEALSAAFSLPKKSPSVSILSPADNAELPPGNEQPLLGAAYDAEDGSLSGAALVWTSDRDGVLGDGSHLHRRLSPGVHQLTLTATDGDGQQALATITVNVHYKVYVPFVAR